MEKAALSRLPVQRERFNPLRVVSGDADVVKLKSFDPVHGGETERRRIVNIHGFCCDWMNGATKFLEGLGVLIAQRIGGYRDTGDVVAICLMNSTVPSGDPLNLFVEGFAGYKVRFGARHT